MDINSVAKKIREAIMNSAEDQGRTFNASILDEVIAKELRLYMPSPPPAPTNYPWVVVPFGAKGGTMSDAKWTDDEIRAIADRKPIPLPINRIRCTDEWR